MDLTKLPTHRIVNGLQVPLTEQEIEAIVSEWEQAAIEVAQRQQEEAEKLALEQARIDALDAFIAAQNNP